MSGNSWWDLNEIIEDVEDDGLDREQEFNVREDYADELPDGDTYESPYDPNGDDGENW